MKFGGVVVRLVDRFYFHWIRHIKTKWNSLSWGRRRFIILAAIFIFAFNQLLSHLYFNVYLTSTYHLHQLKPRLELARGQRGRCCMTNSNLVDICGRSNCLWPCPFATEKEQYENLITSQDQAFFHETSGALWLNFRQACAVESMAYRNPNLTVHVLMNGKNLVKNTATMKTLTENYYNVKISNINLGDYVTGTPLESWYYCTEWNRGPFALAHLSDALRFLSLSKYGGYYSDLDMIQLRPITSHRNFLVAEDDDKLGSSVIHVDHQHPIIQTAVEEFASSYRWYEWAYNGPDLVTRILLKFCQVGNVSQLIAMENCNGFRLLRPRSFYPIHWRQWTDLFADLKNKNVSLLDDPSVIGIHVWNSMSTVMKIRKTSNQLYVDIARSSCPRIFETFPDEF